MRVWPRAMFPDKKRQHDCDILRCMSFQTLQVVTLVVFGLCINSTNGQQTKNIGCTSRNHISFTHHPFHKRTTPCAASGTSGCNDSQNILGRRWQPKRTSKIWLAASTLQLNIYGNFWSHKWDTTRKIFHKFYFWKWSRSRNNPGTKHSPVEPFSCMKLFLMKLEKPWAV